MVSRYPYIDRNSCIVPAGKSFGDPCEKVKNCLHDVMLEEMVDVTRKRYGFVDPKDYGPPRGDKEYSGVFSEIEGCIMGPHKTQFQCIEDEVKNTVYDSYWNKPLGACRDPTPGLPRGMDIYCTTFGKPTKSSYAAGEVVNPRKTSGQVVYEDKACHDLYKYSHQNYYPGERIERSYAPPYDIMKTYGAPTCADHSGAKVKRAMSWFNNDPISNVSRRQAAVRERTSAPIGQSLDRTGVSNMFDYNHAFGKPAKRDFYAVEDLLNDHYPSLLRRDMREFLAYANRLRRHVHEIINKGDLMLEELYEEFADLDEEKTCKLHMDCLDILCKKHFIHLDRSKLDPLLVIMGILSPEGIINYKAFLDFIDLNKDFPPLKREHYIMPPEFQRYDREHVRELPDVKCTCHNYMCEPAGLPSMPKDKPEPKYALSRVNIDELGAESTVRAVISPSIYTQYGVSHRDFFKPRSKEFLADLFRKIGCTLTEEDVDEIYKEGEEMDKSGGVCVETFRNLLDERAYKVYQRLM